MPLTTIPTPRARRCTDAATDPDSVRSAGRAGVIALGVLWLIDGLLQLQPYFFTHFVGGVIAPNAGGQPGVIGAPITFVADLLAPVQAPLNAVAAIVEIGIGIALVTRRAVKPALLVSFAWALGIWFAGEGLGGVFTGVTPNAFTGVIGTAPLYVVAGLLVWPAAGGPSPPWRAAGGLLGPGGARLAWALLWLLGAALWLLPANDGPQALHDLLAGAPSGTGWLAGLQSSAAGAASHAGRGLAMTLAVISAAIAISVVSRRGARIGLWASIPLLLAAWVLVEGLGGLYTGMATDVGTSPLMLFLALQLLALDGERRRRAADLIPPPGLGAVPTVSSCSPGSPPRRGSDRPPAHPDGRTRRTGSRSPWRRSGRADRP